VHVFDVGNGAEAATYRVGPGQIWSSTVVDRAYRVYFADQDGMSSASTPAARCSGCLLPFRPTGLGKPLPHPQQRGRDSERRQVEPPVAAGDT
jgi:hypothetical protein